MRILHIGYGFRPKRSGGLIEYVDDLMNAQAALGWDVNYFLSGRHYPVWRRPWLHGWKHNGVRMFEVINSPVLHGGDAGTAYPEASLSAPQVDAMLRQVLRHLQPEVIHIQELSGLPSSVIDVVHEAGIPALMTLQDYFPLCPTLKLYDHRGENCLRADVAHDCPQCCSGAPRDFSKQIGSTLNYHAVIASNRIPRSIKSALKGFRRSLAPAKPSAAVHPAPASARMAPTPAALPKGDYQRRRDVNLERLQKINLLVAMSTRVAEIYERLGVPGAKLRTIHLTVKHLDQIPPRRMGPIDGVVHFGTLNGMISQQKGARQIVDAMRILNAQGLAERYDVQAWGGLLGELRAEIPQIANLHYRGLYKPNQLNGILDGFHVGLIPSVWEEAFGYVGVEMLSKGVPIIGNARGGMLDYTVDGVSGWLNRSNDAAGMARLMAEIIARPELILERNASVLAQRDRFIKTMKVHVLEMEQVYRSLGRC